jgi:FkbM family methyltransferase
MEKPNSPYLYTFTVFTPTFNRGHTIHRVYESLKTQTCRNFEWLIIDDGSTDNTGKLVEGWQKKADFPIRYLRQENHGKHVAFNRAVLEAQGELFLTFDSDDACVPEALAYFKHYWDNIPEDERNQFSAVTALCVDQYGKVIGDKFPKDVIDSNSLEITYKFKVKGDKWGFQRTEILKGFPFPVIEGEKFIPEGIVWNAIARKFKTRFVNKAVKIIEYLPDGLSNLSASSSHAIGHALWHQSILNNDIDWFVFAPLNFFRSAIHYSRFSFHAGIGLHKQSEQLRLMAKVLWLIFLPIGVVVFFKDKQQEVFNVKYIWKCIGILKEQKHPVRFLLSRVLWRLNLSKYFVIKTDLFKICFFPSSVSAAYWIDHKERKGDENFLVSYLREGDVFVDVGANIGTLSLTAASIVGEKGRVISIEAHPRIFGYLRENVLLNNFKNVSLINTAVGDKQGTIYFSDIRTDDQNSAVPESDLAIPVDILDNLLENKCDEVDLLKVDVEGFEKFVFEGAAHFLAVTKSIYFESWEKHFEKYGYGCSDIFLLLSKHSFKLYRMAGNMILPIDANYSSVVCENLLAIKDGERFLKRTGFQVVSQFL